MQDRTSLLTKEACFPPELKLSRTAHVFAGRDENLNRRLPSLPYWERFRRQATLWIRVEEFLERWEHVRSTMKVEARVRMHVCSKLSRLFHVQRCTIHWRYKRAFRRSLLPLFISHNQIYLRPSCAGQNVSCIQRTGWMHSGKSCTAFPLARCLPEASH